MFSITDSLGPLQHLSISDFNIQTSICLVGKMLVLQKLTVYSELSFVNWQRNAYQSLLQSIYLLTLISYLVNLILLILENEYISPKSLSIPLINFTHLTILKFLFKLVPRTSRVVDNMLLPRDKNKKVNIQYRLSIKPIL